MKIKNFISIIVVLLSLILSGCVDATSSNDGTNEKSNYVGTWTYTDGDTYTDTFQFTETTFTHTRLDSGVQSTSEGTVSANNDQLTLTYTSLNQVHTYTYSVSGNVLTLTDTDNGQNSLYTKENS